MEELILASESPRRRSMLEDLGVRFRAVGSSYHEPPHRGAQAPAEYVCENARGKALAVARAHAGGLVIGADTVVVYRRRVLGKPADMRDAFACLSLLNGKTHAVYTGLCLMHAGRGLEIMDFQKTLVTFRALKDQEITEYLQRIDPMDKAGAYAIQGAGAIIVKSIRGCYYNVVGFPVATLEQMLLRAGRSLFDFMTHAAR